jgi:UDP-2,3-diacylglucosamine pyrophosphatase LpxH
VHRREGGMVEGTGQVAQSLQDQRYFSQVERALDEALDRTRRTAGASAQIDLATGQYIVFSDQHRGIRNRADDFRNNERAYNAALAYYFNAGHHLVVLGDVEELWEEGPGPVTRAYPYSLELEAAFHRAKRYLRIWGNHDDEWQFADSVRRYLDPVFGSSPLQVREGAILKVTDGGQELGELFLLHGHQGTLESDRWSWLSRFFVRYAWRPFQRLTGLSLNTPAEDWDLRLAHNIALYSWAERQSKLVLIAGHTHRPVFKSQSHEAQILAEWTALKAELEQSPAQERRLDLAKLAAQLEWVRAQEQQLPRSEQQAVMAKPCYFNTGCCSYLDGDVTGIEIAGGQISLVRFPDDEGRPQPQILASTSLRDVLNAL